MYDCILIIDDHNIFLKNNSLHEYKLSCDRKVIC